LSAEMLVVIGGVLWIGFAAFHAAFWKMFGWRDELAKLSPPNRMIMQASTVVMIYIFMVLAYVSIIFPDYIARTTAGHVLLLAMLGFWILRTALQFIYGSVKSMISNITGGVCAAMAVYYFLVLSYCIYATT
jgi:hypothetical protein